MRPLLPNIYRRQECREPRGEPLRRHTAAAGRGERVAQNHGVAPGWSTRPNDHECRPICSRSAAVTGRNWSSCARSWRGGGRKRLGAAASARYAALYRSVCADLALADSYQLPPGTVQYLHRLVGRAHNQLYRSRVFDFAAWGEILFTEVPQRVFNDRCVQFAFCFFWAVLLFVGLAGGVTPLLARLCRRGNRRGEPRDVGGELRRADRRPRPGRQSAHGSLLHSTQHDDRPEMFRRQPVRVTRTVRRAL